MAAVDLRGLTKEADDFETALEDSAAGFRNDTEALVFLPAAATGFGASLASIIFSSSAGLNVAIDGVSRGVTSNDDEADAMLGRAAPTALHAGTVA